MRERRLRLITLAVILMAILMPCFLFLAGGNCNGVCPNPEEPCCCPKKDGYYLRSYTCACAGGQLQYQECHYTPLS